jgi:single-strand DNA-binding protein
MQNINRVVISGNLTRDPELRTTSGGTTICKLRIAVNSRIKQQGEWVDKPNYFDVTVFGNQAENVNRYLAKGRGAMIDGRLEWHEWTTDSGDKRQQVGIIADTIQFLSDGHREREPESDIPVDTSDFGPAPSPIADDDIPF